MYKRQARGPAAARGFTLDSNMCSRLAQATEGFSGAEIEQAVVTGLFDAFAERRPLAERDLLRAVRNTVPLSVTQAESITASRNWASSRAVAATASEDVDAYSEGPTENPDDVAGWRGGRRIEFLSLIHI